MQSVDKETQDEHEEQDEYKEMKQLLKTKRLVFLFVAHCMIIINNYYRMIWSEKNLSNDVKSFCHFAGLFSSIAISDDSYMRNFIRDFYEESV